MKPTIDWPEDVLAWTEVFSQTLGRAEQLKRNPDKVPLQDLDDAVRKYPAWNSVLAEKKRSISRPSRQNHRDE